MTPTEKEQLWNCIMKMRSMPWKGPRGGTYNWTQREMRELYKKLVVYGDNNQPDAAWRLLNSGKYKYMIYPWKKGQIYNCISFLPPAYLYGAKTPSPGVINTIGTYEIYDVDTSNTLVSASEWEDMFIQLQALSYKVFGSLDRVGKCFNVIIEASIPPNWELRYDPGSGFLNYPLTFSLISTDVQTNKGRYSYYSWASCPGIFSDTPASYYLSEISLIGPYSGSVPASTPISLDNPFGLEKFMRACFGAQCSLIKHAGTNPTADIVIGYCGAYDAQPSLMSSVVISNLYGSPYPALCSSAGSAPIANCNTCYWSIQIYPYAYPSGWTVNGLDADDPATWSGIAATYNGYAAYVLDFVTGNQTVTLNLSTEYTNLPTLNLGPGIIYYTPSNYTSPNPSCEPFCIQVVIPVTDQYIDMLYDLNFSYNFSLLLGIPIDLADNATAQAIFQSIYQQLYGPSCTATVITLPSGDYEVTVYNHWYGGFGFPSLFSNTTSTNYPYGTITCP